MIGEPEMADEDGQEAARDTVSDADRPPLLGRYGRKPWVWAAGAVVLTSAVWAGALQATGYGRTHAPDLHGYRITDTLCAEANFQGLLDALDAHTFDEPGLVITTRSSALDRADCSFSAMSADGAEQFTIAVAVDLHKKTDPAAEFDAVKHVDVPTPTHSDGLTVGILTTEVPATHPRGIGDRANLTSTKYRQELAVRHGGAVLTLTLSAVTQVKGLDKNGDLQDPRPADTQEYAKDLAPAMRHLMSALSHPAAVSGSSSPQ